jgi:peptidoglycan/LPS O-acetylase OafA/YrhL
MGAGLISLRAAKMPRIPDLSYGIYIYHAPLFALLHMPLWEFFPLLAVFCAASWYLVEKPALRLKTTNIKWPFVRSSVAEGTA